MAQFIENLQAVRQAAGEDLSNSTLGEKFTFYGSAALLTMHEFGMEAALVAAGTNVYEWSHNPVAVCAALGTLSLATETTLTLGISRSVEAFPSVTQEVEERYYTSQIATPEKPSRGKAILNAIDTTGLALTLGSPGVILRSYARDPNRGYEENKKTGFRAAKALAAFNALVTGSAIGASGWIAEKFGTEAVSKFVVEAGHSLYTYAGIAGYVGLRTLSAARNNRKQRQKNLASESPEA